MTKTVEMEAYCSACGKVTMQVASFAGKFLKDRKCQECGAVERGARAELLKAYADELLDRALSKPFRLRQEWKEDRVRLLHSLPGRVLKRPAREARYLAELLQQDEKADDQKPTDPQDDGKGENSQTQ